MSACDHCGSFCSPACAPSRAAQRLTDAKTEELIAMAKRDVLATFAASGKVAAWEAVCALPPESAQQFYAIEALEAELAKGTGR